ncbi:hypothetical protein [Bradyrhizobium australiense]|uniref:Uncharacterized protein n=1 Tax=Bradyrhizobium australiense TaxID=2721161 RepID=A0A7Y4GNK3_9BRAD|nr:hypothetical protein [Bradyrhizobium australiense]NOJ39085.1 hypothetical protein [Bradyrhizobium australiense]
MTRESCMRTDPEHRPTCAGPLLYDKVDFGRRLHDAIRLQWGLHDNVVEAELPEVTDKAFGLIGTVARFVRRNKQRVLFAIETRRHRKWLEATPPQMMRRFVALRAERAMSMKSGLNKVEGRVFAER